MAIDVRTPLKKFIPHLIASRDQNLNEADIVVRLIKVRVTTDSLRSRAN